MMSTGLAGFSDQGRLDKFLTGRGTAIGPRQIRTKWPKLGWEADGLLWGGVYRKQT